MEDLIHYVMQDIRYKKSWKETHKMQSNHRVILITLPPPNLHPQFPLVILLNFDFIAIKDYFKFSKIDNRNDHYSEFD